MQTLLGANGTIGSLLAKELPAYTGKIRLVSRNPVKINENDELFPADLRDPAVVDKAIAGSSVVYLLVGFEYKLSTWKEQWPRLMRAVIDSCIRHGAKLVFFDNVYSYPVSAIGHMTEAAPLQPPSKKGAVRAELVNMLMQETGAGRLQALIARSADFYGPACKTSFFTEVVFKNFSKGKAANWFINADKIHSFTYTPDAAKATALLGNTADAYNQVWHLPTSGEKLTGRELVALAAAEMQVKNRLMVMPMWMLKLAGWFIPLLREMPEMMYQMDRDYFFDSKKFQERFNYRPVTYKEGIGEIVKEGI